MKAGAKCGLLLALAGMLPVCSAVKKDPTASAAAPLILVGVMTMPNVVGRLDHFAIGPADRLFVSAYGNNTEEVFSLPREAVEATIPVPVPQGVVFSPEANELFVGSDEGQLHIFQGSLLRPVRTISFGDDVDDLRYDAAARRVYVGYGDGSAGAIAAVDATTNSVVGERFKLGAHPEAFEVEKDGPSIFVNVPALHEIAVINRRTGAIARWHLKLGGNFPMALDERDHRLFVATHDPPRLAVFDADSGRLVAALPAVANEDDMYYDRARKRIYITGGEGYISVFQQADANHYVLFANVPSAIGARTSGYWGRQEKSFDRFYVGVPAPARGCNCAEVLIYSVHN